MNAEVTFRQQEKAEGQRSPLWLAGSVALVSVGRAVPAECGSTPAEPAGGAMHPALVTLVAGQEDYK